MTFKTCTKDFTGLKYHCKVTDSVLILFCFLVFFEPTMIFFHLLWNLALQQTFLILLRRHLFGKLWPWTSVKWGNEVSMSLSVSLLIKTKLNIRMVFVLCPLPQEIPSVYKPFAVSLLSVPHPREGAPPSESECNQNWLMESVGGKKNTFQTHSVKKTDFRHLRWDLNQVLVCLFT